MTAELLAEHANARAYHADWRDLLEVVRAEGGCDCLCVDAPYSERTHAGHDGAAAAEDGATWTRSNGRVEAKIQRRDINYSAWSPETVRAFVEAWSPLVRGWIVSMTDDVLFPHWREAMMGVDRQTFQDIPAVIRGMTVRLTGDGPSSWAIHCAVGRSRSKEMARWGTLPGAYSGPSERQEAVGGKPLWLMERLVEDYSRPGDLVVDPCMGAGTTLVAAQRTGRRSIGGDAMRAHAELAAKRISRPAQQPLFLAGGR